MISRASTLELQVASAQVEDRGPARGSRRQRFHKRRPSPARVEITPSGCCAAAGAKLRVGDDRVELEPGDGLASMTWDVPGDISSAAFLLAAAALVEDSDLTITNLGLNPSRAGIPRSDVQDGGGDRGQGRRRTLR